MQEGHKTTEENELRQFEARLREVYMKQADIGWENFIKGYIIRDWGIKQEKYYRKNNEEGIRYTKYNWSRQLITGLQTFTMTIWKQRNEAIHRGQTKEAQETQQNDDNKRN